MSGPAGITLNAGSGGASLGVDSDGTYDYQLVKIGYSASGSTPTQVSSSNPLPVTVSNASLAVTGTFWQSTQPVSLASLPALPAGSNVIGGVTQSGTWTVTVTGLPSAAALSDSLANPTTVQIGSNLLGWDATNSVWRRVQVNAGTGAAQVYVTNGISPAASKYSGAVTSTLVLVKGSAAVLSALDIYSPSANTGDVFLQVFDAASTGSVTLGSTAPAMSIGMAGAGGGSDRTWAAGVTFTNGIVIAATTTRSGSTAPANALAVNIEYT